MKPVPPSVDTVPGSEPQTTVLPLVEERVDIAVERVDSGALRVRIVVDETAESTEVDLVQTEVRPTVVPRDVEVDERREPYLDGEELVVPVYEERAVVVHKLFLKEEVRLTRIRHEQRQPVEVSLRRERAVVERQQPDGSWQVEPAVLQGTPLASKGS